MIESYVYDLGSALSVHVNVFLDVISCYESSLGGVRLPLTFGYLIERYVTYYYNTVLFVEERVSTGDVYLTSNLK